MRPRLSLTSTVMLWSPVDRFEIERLYNSNKYGILLEKGLNVLNLQKNYLSDSDREFLFYYIAVSYIKNKNTDIAKSYLEILVMQLVSYLMTLQ